MKPEEIIFNKYMGLMEKGLFMILFLKKKSLLTLADLSLLAVESEDVLKESMHKLIDLGVVVAIDNGFKLNDSKKRKSLKNLVTRSELEDLYILDELSVNEIAKKLNHNPESVRRLMDKMGIKRRTDANGSIHFFAINNENVNVNFFKVKSPELHQIMGYFLTDGYISKARTVVMSDGSMKEVGNPAIAIELTDKEVIEWIAKTIGYKNKIYVRKRGGNLKPTYTIKFANKEVLEIMKRYGMTERKSNTLILKELLDRHTVRGSFEGDGCISKTKDGRYIVSMSSGSEKFLMEVRNYIENAIGGTSEVRGRVIKSGNTHYTFTICSQEKVKKFGEFIYEGDVFAMKRKRDRFIEAGANIKNGKE